MPKYPVYTTQPLTGSLPSLVQMGPGDLRPSSGTAPHFARLLQTGRHLAGLGADDPESCPSCASDLPLLPASTTPSEDSSLLSTMEKDDDVEGNGIFDSARRRPINYPDAGIFASNYGIPGYIARGRSFAESEVVDVTTGSPVVYVPGGAVSIDDSAKVAFMEGRAIAHDRETGLRRPQRLRTVPIDSVAMDEKPITGNSIVVTPETVPTVAVNAAAAAASEISRSLPVKSVATPTSTNVVAPTTVTTGNGTSKALLAVMMCALGFGVGYVVTRKPKPVP